MKQSYTVIRDVLRVHGSQTFCVKAESHEEAAALVCAGKGEFDCEEIEVQELSDHCEVSLPDDRKSTRIDGRKARLPISSAQRIGSTYPGDMPQTDAGKEGGKWVDTHATNAAGMVSVHTQHWCLWAEGPKRL